jgi:hypothetical protein
VSEGAATTTAPVFVTKETLATFAGQTAAVTLVWKVFGGDDATKWIPAVVTAVLSLVIWITGLGAMKGKPDQILLSLVIAAVNGFMVYAAVIGLDVTGDQAGIDATNPAIDDASK